MNIDRVTGDESHSRSSNSENDSISVRETLGIGNKCKHQALPPPVFSTRIQDSSVTLRCLTAQPALSCFLRVQEGVLRERNAALHEILHRAASLCEPYGVLVEFQDNDFRLKSGSLVTRCGYRRQRNVTPVFLGFCIRKGGILGNLVSDVHLAALAIEHGLTLCSADGDFARFASLTWRNPLAPA